MGSPEREFELTRPVSAAVVRLFQTSVWEFV
jgi:hypothetical protein